MHRPALLVVALLLVASAVGASGALQTAGGGAAAGDGPSAQHVERVQEQDFNSTTFTITVYDNGTARWTFEYGRTLTSADEEAEFREYADRFENNETDLYNRFTEQASALTTTGAEETNREMEATNFNRTAYIESPGLDHRTDSRGIVEMSFLWTNFAQVDEDGTVTVGDVFEGGLYIGSSQRLVIEAGDGLVFESVRPDPAYTAASLEDAESVYWSGEREFLDGQPSAVLVPADGLGDSDSPGGDGDPDDGNPDDPDGGDSSDAMTEGASAWALAAGFLLLVAVGATAAYRRFGDQSRPPDETGDDVRSSDDGASADDADTGISDEELLTDEDRVVSLIKENGGRMKQVDIVEETGWSKSKVSMLLSDMAEDGTISKLRVGRENIISLEGFEPEATKSPFDE